MSAAKHHPDLVAQLKAAAEILEKASANRALLSTLSQEERTRLLKAAGDIYCPDLTQRREAQRLVAHEPGRQPTDLGDVATVEGRQIQMLDERLAVGQHQAGAADTDMLVGGLHQLPARDRRESGGMALQALFRRTHVEPVQGANIGLGLQLGQAGPVDEANPGAPGHPERRRPRPAGFAGSRQSPGCAQLQ